MARKRFTAESIIIKLREAEVGLAQGEGECPVEEAGGGSVLAACWFLFA